MNPSMNYECGLLIEGFDTPPFFMMTHNPPYYQRLIEGCGFGKVEDMFAFYGRTEMLQTLDKKLAFIVEECRKRFDIKLRRMDRRRFRPAKCGCSWTSTTRPWSAPGALCPCRRRKSITWPPRMKHLIAPEMTTIAEIDGRARRLPVRPARLQHPHQANRRPAVSLRLHPPALEQEGHQTGPADQHQRHSRVSKMGPGPGDCLAPRARRPRLGHRRGRIQLGAGEQQAFVRHAEARRGADHEAVSPLRFPGLSD